MIDLEKLREKQRGAYTDVVLPAIKAAVDRLTLKEAAWLANAKPSQLADALADRDKKNVQLEWLVNLFVAAPEPVRRELVAVLNHVAGYRPPELRRQLTPLEEIEVRKRATERLAPGIVAAIEEEVANS